MGDGIALSISWNTRSMAGAVPMIASYARRPPTYRWSAVTSIFSRASESRTP